MSHLLFWPTVTFFYPVGNTSAVCLTENLPPETKADILLLACGDPRHILYTIYANETSSSSQLRAFDITCCDIDAAVLARNALLFTLLADDGNLDRLDSLWNLFYHMYVDERALSMLFEQCRKLIPLAESTETWRAGPYGRFLTTCDAATLAQLRRIWTAYLDTASFSSKQAKQFEQRFADGMKDMTKRVGPQGTTTAMRSAGPFAPHAYGLVIRQFDNYWSSGVTDNGTQGNKSQGQKRRLKVNPTFAFSIEGDKFAVHYGTDPLCGFHLAEAFVASKFSRPLERIPPHELVRSAKDQFSRWCTSMSKRLKSSNTSSSTFVIRMYAGDALSFCQALKYCEVTQSPVTPYNVAAWQLSTITFDDHYYGRNACAIAPLSFNVIDTSNVLDHLGLVNILVATAPLLRKTPSATLYTEALLKTGGDPSQAIFEHLCGDLPTMALLLGIVPSTFLSQFTTYSNVHEAMTTSKGSKQFRERFAWKAIGLGGPSTAHVVTPTPPQRLCFSPDDLAAFFFRVYHHMFADEDVTSRFELLSLSPERVSQVFQRSGILHYNRRSLVLLVHFVKTRVQTDWARTMKLFGDLALADKRLITGQHAWQELCCQLHLLGVYTAPWISDPSLWRSIPLGNGGPFRDWTPTSIPQVVTLVLVVPRAAIARLEPEFENAGTPVLQCDMHDGSRQNWFAVTSATFGTLRVSGAGEHRVGVIIEGDADATAGIGVGQPPWRTDAPLIITFSVLSSSVMDFALNTDATVGLALRPTMSVSVQFAGTLGFDLTVFRTPLANPERVFVLAQRPVVGTGTPTAGMAGHWEAKAGGVERATGTPDASRRSTDVHVQMDDAASTVRSFTVRIDITDPDAQAVLADVQTIPTVSSSSGSPRSLEACVRIGTHTRTVQFPLPVDMARAKLRIARRSSYIEVVVPPAPFDVRPERDLSSRFVSLTTGPDDDGTLTLGSIHRVNLDRCPTFEYRKIASALNWCDLHVGLMFSDSERERMRRENSSDTQNPTANTLVQVKQTLHVLLRCAAGCDPETKGPEKVFALFQADPSSQVPVPYLYIVVAHMRLDVGSHTVVADAFVALHTPAVHAALNVAMHGAFARSPGPRNPGGTGIRYISTDADETAAWFHLLPCLTERCRTWSHKATCVYRTTSRPQPQPKVGEGARGVWGGQSPLCACGVGIGTESLPTPFARVAPYLTRAALSPLFSVPYLKEVDGPVTHTSGEVGPGTSPKGPNVADGARCRSCGKEGGRVCSRCRRVRYCSEGCQRADWKAHKKDCRGGSEATRGSDLA